MEIEYKGATALTIKTSGATVTIDPKLELFGLKNLKTSDAIEIVTDKKFAIKNGSEKVLIDGPGEYEVSNVAIKGVAARRHLDSDGKNSTIYRIVIGGYRVAVVGNVTEDLSEDQLEDLGVVDIAIIPVGGGGYTLDAHGAAKVAKALDPKLIIPVNYADKDIKYEVPQADLEPFIRELGTVQHDTAEKLKLKAGAMLTETLSLLELKRT